MFAKPLVIVSLALLGLLAPAHAMDLSKPVVLVAKPELRDRFYGATILVATPLGDGQHVGFIINRPTTVTLGMIFPEHGPSQKIKEPVYLGGPVDTQILFALVNRRENPGGHSLELMPGLFAAFDADVVDRIIEAEPGRARFVAGLVAWGAGELQSEVQHGAWYVMKGDPELILRNPEGLWEELVRRSVAMRMAGA
jgi:putative transcriptional regulator